MKTLLMMLLTVSMAYSQAKTAPQQGPPPKNLTQRGDGHFSANADPANPEKFEVYIVKPNDTLSAIAGQVMKNPRLWPQLWEQNEHIVNPHWIYPSDKILIKPITLITEAAPPTPEPPPPTPEPPPPPQERQPLPIPPSLLTKTPPPAGPRQVPLFETPPEKPAPEIKATDMYCSGFIRRGSITVNTVIAKFNSNGSALATVGDYVYLDHGAGAGAKVGDQYQIIRPTRKIHLESRDLGMHYLDIGQVQVVMAQPDFSLARVTVNCEAIELGDFVVPFQDLPPPPLPRPRPFSPFITTSGGVKGFVAITREVLQNFGSAFHASGVLPGSHSEHLEFFERGIASPGSIVYIDVGLGAGVKPGDVFIVYRTTELDGRLWDASEGKRVENQKEAIGEVVVLRVEERSATALVTYSSTGISAGDSVERR